MKRTAQNKMFGGSQEVWTHSSRTLACEMNVGVYLPPQASDGPCPVLYWLSGLTCTEQNFVTKAGAQRFAAKHGIIVVAPDTSPRGDDVADADGYDLGKGAGFYVNATQQPWAKHYRMYDYIVDEIPALIEEHFDVTEKRSVAGHSMGGHGALIVALKNPGMFQSVSAFAPIVALSKVPWGEKAFVAYLGDERKQWSEWDACELIDSAKEQLPLLIDQGDSDEFLENQLHPERLKAACEATGHPLNLRIQPGYDHSFFTIATFIGEHFEHHAKALLS